MKIFIHYPIKYVYLKIIDEDAKEFEKYAKKILKKYKVLLIIYYFIIFIFLLFSFIYLTLFCIKLPNNQINLLIGVLISNLFGIILKILFVLTITIYKLYFLGLWLI